jgi:hypothetical protein
MRVRIVCVALGALSLGSLASAVWAQGATSATYVGQAFIRVTASASDNAKLGNFGYDDGICILGAWVDCRDDVQFWLSLRKDDNYMLVAGGDNDCQDVQIDVLDENGKQVAGEKRVAPDASVTFAPPADGWYLMKLSLMRSRNNLPCVCVACILKENGHQIPLKNLDDSADKLLKLFSDNDRLLHEKDGKRLEFRKARNQWGLYGAVLDQGQTKNVTNLDLGVGRKLFLALGDQNTEDVDLFILDKAGQVLEKDTKVNSEAIVRFTPAPGGRYGIKMLNYKGPGPAVIMTGIFDVYTPQKK